MYPYTGNRPGAQAVTNVAHGFSCLTRRLRIAHDSAMPRQSETASTDLEILGARIARAREGKGLTKTDVARKLGVRNATVGDWEAGRYTPRGDSLRALAEVLGMTVDELLDVTEGKAPPFPSWATFLERHPELADHELRFLRTLSWGPGHEPTVATYDVILATYRSTRAA